MRHKRWDQASTNLRGARRPVSLSPAAKVLDSALLTSARVLGRFGETRAGA